MYTVDTYICMVLSNPKCKLPCTAHITTDYIYIYAITYPRVCIIEVQGHFT